MRSAHTPSTGGPTPPPGPEAAAPNRREIPAQTFPPALPFVAYIRVSTDEQADSGAGLAAQRAAIDAEAARRGWQLAETYCEAASAKSTDGRPALAAALAELRAGRAQGLIVSKLDRFVRSLRDFTELAETFKRHGWVLVALDLGVDTSSPQGEMMANIMASFAQFERRLIGQRTKDALAAKRAAGTQLGRPRAIPPAVELRIRKRRKAGATLRQIAEELAADNVPTRSGRPWRTSTIQAVLGR